MKSVPARKNHAPYVPGRGSLTSFAHAQRQRTKRRIRLGPLEPGFEPRQHILGYETGPTTQCYSPAGHKVLDLLAELLETVQIPNMALNQLQTQRLVLKKVCKMVQLSLKVWKLVKTHWARPQVSKKHLKTWRPEPQLTKACCLGNWKHQLEHSTGYEIESRHSGRSLGESKSFATWATTMLRLPKIK